MYSCLPCTELLRSAMKCRVKVSVLVSVWFFAHGLERRCYSLVAQSLRPTFCGNRLEWRQEKHSCETSTKVETCGLTSGRCEGFWCFCFRETRRISTETWLSVCSPIPKNVSFFWFRYKSCFAPPKFTISPCVMFFHSFFQDGPVYAPWLDSRESGLCELWVSLQHALFVLNRVLYLRVFHSSDCSQNVERLQPNRFFELFLSCSKKCFLGVHLDAVSGKKRPTSTFNADFFQSLLFYVFDNLVFRIPPTGFMTQWFASTSPALFLKLTYYFLLISNYLSTFFSVLFCLVRLFVVYFPDSHIRVSDKNFFWTRLSIQKIQLLFRFYIPVSFVLPFLLTLFFLPATVYCRQVTTPYGFGAVYFNYVGAWLNVKSSEGSECSLSHSRFTTTLSMSLSISHQRLL